MATKYDAWTMTQLQAEFVRLGNELSVINGERRTILKLMETREADAMALAKVSALDPLEREALKRALEEPSTEVRR